MKIFGHNGLLSKIDHGVSKAFHEANKFGEKVFGDNSWYAGTDGVAVGETAENIMSQKLGGTNYATNYATTKPKAYQANVAGTAKSIAQGGMTKDEVQDFNIKHPNETAIRRN